MELLFHDVNMSIVCYWRKEKIKQFCEQDNYVITFLIINDRKNNICYNCLLLPSIGKISKMSFLLLELYFVPRITLIKYKNLNKKTKFEQLS